MKKVLINFVKQRQSKPLETFAIVVLTLAMIVLLSLYFNTQNDDDWAQFVVDHHCTANKFKADQEQKAGWQCDDGKIYYRWRQQI